MRKIQLSIDKTFQREADFIEKELLSWNIAFAMGSSASRYFFSIALPNNGEVLVKNIISDIIAVQFKKRFFEQEIPQVKALSKDACALVLSCLTFLDFDEEFALVRKSLDSLLLDKTKSVFAVDGIYNFMFKSLREEWTNIAEPTASNLAVLLSPSLRGGLLESTLTTRSCAAMELTVTDSKVTAVDKRPVKIRNLFDDEKHNIVATIIENNPRKIKIVHNDKMGLKKLLKDLINTTVVGDCGLVPSKF